MNLFVYMTNYDGAFTGDDNIDDNFVKHLAYYAPFMEAIFIALGCLVPVFLNIAMNRRSEQVEQLYSWVVVGVVGGDGADDVLEQRRCTRNELRRQENRSSAPEPIKDRGLETRGCEGGCAGREGEAYERACRRCDTVDIFFHSQFIV